MKKHAFVLIRYSVLASNNSSWVIGRDNEFENYKKSLFSQERMSLHEELFFNVTVPSLQNMSSDSVTIMLFTSEELPTKNMEKLVGLQDKMTNLEVIPLSCDGSVIGKMQLHLSQKIKSFGQDVCYATIRLDDDDALADDFEENIFRYIDPAYQGHAVSFSKGYEGIYEKGSYSAFIERMSPKIAMGLSYIGLYDNNKNSKVVSIYDLGNHTKVDEKHPLIINPLLHMYIRTVHSESDIFAKNFSKKISNYKDVDGAVYKDVKKRFSCFRDESKKIVEDFPSIGAIGESGSPYCVTHHNTIAFYSKIKNELSHKVLSDITLEEGDELVLVDADNGCLILRDSKKYLSYSSGKLSLENSSLNATKLTKIGKGFYLSLEEKGKSFFFSAERNGSFTFKEKCRAWGIFYCN